MSAPSIQSQKEQRLHLVKLVRRWGGLATDALLDPACQIFTIPQIEGLIGYRLAHGCVIVYGDPVCAPQDVPQLAQAFHNFYQKQCRNIIYLITSEKFAHWAIQHTCKALVEYGEEIYLDPHHNPTENHGTHASLVRRKVRHATHEGTIVKEYLPYDHQIEQSLEQVGISWLKSRHGPQVHISNIHLFVDRIGKRWFYAQQGNHMVGIVVLNQLETRQGWHLNHLMFTPDAPGGTPELLVITVLNILKNENCSFVSLGAAPAHRLGKMMGLSGLSTWMTRTAYQIADKMFHLSGHQTFWGKFSPQISPSYLLFSQSSIGWREILAIFQALNISFGK